MTEAHDTGRSAPGAEDAVAAAKAPPAPRACRARAPGAEPRRSLGRAARRALLELPELAARRRRPRLRALPDEIDPLAAVAALRAEACRSRYPRVESPGVLGVHAVDRRARPLPGPRPIGAARRRPRSRPAASTRCSSPAWPSTTRRPPRLRRRLLRPAAAAPAARLRALGLAFDEQILDEIPAEDARRAVDVVVTPRGSSGLRSRMLAPSGDVGGYFATASSSSVTNV